MLDVKICLTIVIRFDIMIKRLREREEMGGGRGKRRKENRRGEEG